MAAKKNDGESFVFYKSFFDMVNYIPDAEVRAEAYAAICEYAFNNTEIETENPMVNMVLASIKPLIDANRKRRENGNQGGRESNKKKTTGSKNKEPMVIDKKTNGFENLENEEPNVDVNVNEDVDVNADVNVHVDDDDEEDVTVACDSVCGDDASGSQQHSKLVKWLDIMTTTTDMEQFKALTSRLFQTYRPKRISLIDCEKTVNAVQVLGVTADGTHYAAYDQQKAALLEYAFQQAAAAENVTWKYIGGIYRNFEERGITTVEQAEAYEFERQHGQTPEHFLNHFYGE